MASALTDKLSRLVKDLRGQGRITESNVTDMLREVRMALLEADVALPVVRDFIARVKEKALGQEVLGSLQPGQVLVSIVNRELAASAAASTARAAWLLKRAGGAGVVVLGYGPQPMDFFTRAMKITGKDAVLDPDVM